MAVLDTEIILRGDRASQPAAASTKKGALYYVTDEDLVERNTGSAWEPMGGQYLTADPASPANGRVWFKLTGSGPYELTVNVRVGGATKSAPLATLV